MHEMILRSRAPREKSSNAWRFTTLGLLAFYLGSACEKRPEKMAYVNDGGHVHSNEGDGSVQGVADSQELGDRGMAPQDGRSPDNQDLEALQRAFVDLRFGMFIHFGILTYTGNWAGPNLDISQFNPVELDPGQWADAAVAAKMKYGVLTAKHHDGFALWPSAASTFNVGRIPWKGGKGDVVRAYVDAFRSRGLLPGLYYSIWDTTQGVSEGSLSPEKLAYVKTQITELLSNYGPIPILVMDGWSWQMGHQAIAYQEIYSLVKSLQPHCLLTDHTHLAEPFNVDIVNFEEPKGGWAPNGNTYPAQQGTKVNGHGGNDWFWGPNLGGFMSVDDIVTRHLGDLEMKWTNLLLNCPPNRSGKMDETIVALLKEVGSTWTPNYTRPPLPGQGPQNTRPYTPLTATATSGNARYAIDGKNDSGFHSMWQPTGPLPQSITLDLGELKPDVGWLGYTPHAVGDMSTTIGNITSFRILTSADSIRFNEIVAGTWPPDGKFKTMTFAPLAARFVRFEVLAANGNPSVTEISVGGQPQ